MKDMTLEDEPLRLKGVQHATEEEQGTRTSSSRANEVIGPKSDVDVPGSKTKV